MYRFRDFYIRDQMMEGIRDYIDHGVPCGSFLTAVICNDLKNAVGRADEENLRNLPAFVGYFYSEAPAPCWGSEEEMNAWMKMHAQIRIKASYDKGECPRCRIPIPAHAEDGSQCQGDGCGWVFDRDEYKEKSHDGDASGGLDRDEREDGADCDIPY